ncbi:MAG: hypothetical protein V4507_00125 [Verrucomicrobiota bacterium]
MNHPNGERKWSADGLGGMDQGWILGRWRKDNNTPFAHAAKPTIAPVNSQ